jgi:hypothetical protein
MQAIFESIVAGGIENLNKTNLRELYRHKNQNNFIGKFVDEFAYEIRTANKLNIYARYEYSFIQCALRHKFPPPIAKEIAGYINKVQDLPVNKGDKTWLKTIAPGKSRLQRSQIEILSASMTSFIQNQIVSNESSGKSLTEMQTMENSIPGINLNN